MLPKTLMNNVCRIVAYLNSSKVSPAYYNILRIFQGNRSFQPIFITAKTKHTSASLADNYKPGLNQAKSKLILQMNFKSGEEAVPFYKLPMKTLIHVYKVTKADETKGYCKNRLYYISDKIQLIMFALAEIRLYLWQNCDLLLTLTSLIYLSVPVKVRSWFIAGKYTFSVLGTIIDGEVEDMGVSGDRILRDLWVLKYHHETIRQRLQRVKDTGVDNLYPWMIRCSEDILNRYITIFQETKIILGHSKSTQTYLADRLNTTPEAVQDMCIKIPALKTIRVTKVKHFLDFLINEGFQVEDIASKPRVLTASKKTVQQRLEKLRLLGISDINLNVLCRSKKDFKKYCDSIVSLKENVDAR